MTGHRVLGFLGLRGADINAPFSILVPPGRRVSNVPFPVIADVALGDHDARYGPVPGTTPALTLAELARGGVNDAELLNVFDRLRWAGLLTRARLEVGLRALECHPGVPRLLELLDSGAADPESPPERLLVPLLESVCAGVEVQVWVAPHVRVDALWRDLSIVVEYIGRDAHGDGRDRMMDSQRDALLRELGYAVIYIAHEDLADPERLRRRLLVARATRRAELASAA